MTETRPSRGAARGAAHGRSKLDDDKVRAIRRKYRDRSITTQALAEEYGISRPTVFDIATGKTWTHVPFEDEAEEKSA